MYARKGSKKCSRKRGHSRQHVTLIACISASGKPVVPYFLFPNKKVRGEWFCSEACDVVVTATGNGWSDTDIFFEWLEEVLVPSVEPNKNRRKKQLLFLAGSRTHLNTAHLKKSQALGLRATHDRCNTATG